MGTVQCRNCKGTGAYYPRSGKRLDCKACRGTGINQKLYSARCEAGYCSQEIVYPRDKPAPRFCKRHRNEQLTKTCAQYGCYETITFKRSWTDTDYCRKCKGARKHGSTAKSCNGKGFGANCGKLIWVPRGKNFTMCRDCNDKARAKKASQWKEMSCPKCYSGKIKYHVDWKNAPKMCKACKEKDQLKWQEKTCKSCSNKIKYNTDWDHPPNFCKSCKQEQQNKRREKPCERRGCSGKVKYNIDWTHPPKHCHNCNNQRLKVDRNHKGTFQAKTKKGELVLTFGRCNAPPARKTGAKAVQKRSWAEKGYWWVSLPGKHHETMIVEKQPVVGGFIQISNQKDISFSSASLQNAWALLAIAIVNLNDL